MNDTKYDSTSLSQHEKVDRIELAVEALRVREQLGPRTGLGCPNGDDRSTRRAATRRPRPFTQQDSLTRPGCTTLPSATHRHTCVQRPFKPTGSCTVSITRTEAMDLMIDPTVHPTIRQAAFLSALKDQEAEHMRQYQQMIRPNCFEWRDHRDPLAHALGSGDAGLICAALEHAHQWWR